MPLLARVPGGVAALMQPLRIPALRSTPIAFGWLSKNGIDADALESYVRPALADRQVRHDLAKVLRGIHPRYTLEAASHLSEFDKPVLLAWSREKAFFPVAHAERLAGDFPNARLEWIEDSYAFVPEDRPRRLAELISAFAREPAQTAAA
jgi:pimeloyl-ACP methyl ester carboxylesterase